ncbi:DeoR/GlpR family DNA-binding transcription regulator [Dactylosporangium sp. NBC_01737]|uniref:DeoR/GlpR family DNA-binding transcription regulator n=1 Tax=Dactylosporangium sp. NBC_01737 TaxID=2975959 RepID=UPI002E158CFA|nr:DeoR/GlpR family DNA-binding transcription regulator [Dactylosporangium sp. NBC_01737]
MHVPDRLDLTLRLVRGSGRLTLAELATRLGVSEMTVRRDLDQLQEQGLVRRVRGGAVALDVPSDEAGFTVREQWRSATKARLARATADLIAPGSTVLLDAGTTTAAVAAALAARFATAPTAFTASAAFTAPTAFSTPTAPADFSTPTAFTAPAAFAAGGGSGGGSGGAADFTAGRGAVSEEGAAPSAGRDAASGRGAASGGGAAASAGRDAASEGEAAFAAGGGGAAAGGAGRAGGRGAGPLTVAVLSLQAAVRLADQPGIRLLILGGESRAGERSLVGPLALSALDQLRFDTFIMSIGAVHHDLGWSEFDLDDAAVKRAALRRAGRTVVVADASKLGVQAFARVAPLEAADTFVTSDAAPSGEAAIDTLAALRAAGVEVITTDNPEEIPS